MAPQERNRAAQDFEQITLRHSTVGADRMLQFRPAQGGADAIERRKSFIQEFTASKGPPQIVVLIMLLALGFGSTIGVVRSLYEPSRICRLAAVFFGLTSRS